MKPFANMMLATILAHEQAMEQIALAHPATKDTLAAITQLTDPLVIWIKLAWMTAARANV